jgi:hypothetical protein
MSSPSSRVPSGYCHCTPFVPSMTGFMCHRIALGSYPDGMAAVRKTTRHACAPSCNPCPTRLTSRHSPRRPALPMASAQRHTRRRRFHAPAHAHNVPSCSRDALSDNSSLPALCVNDLTSKRCSCTNMNHRRDIAGGILFGWARSPPLFLLGGTGLIMAYLHGRGGCRSGKGQVARPGLSSPDIIRLIHLENGYTGELKICTDEILI